jgi:ubiquinone/menaquinone biosynthesis C-methylase UbiE
MTFRNAEESHAHSLETLNLLFEHGDFMESIDTMVDLGCGEGLDTEWWATRTTQEDSPTPLNINCIGVDNTYKMSVAKKYHNIQYQPSNFENGIQTYPNKKFDVLWCHDAFQYAINPLATLSHWWNIASDGAMLAIIVPQTTNVKARQYVFTQQSGCYYHHTMVSLIHMLSVSGWDCRTGFFKKSPNDHWLHAVVYKSTHPPLDYYTSWYQLADLKLLPESADTSINRFGELRQQDLILPWIDKSLMHLGLQ